MYFSFVNKNFFFGIILALSTGVTSQKQLDFKSNDGTVIAFDKLCDNKRDCPDFKDEYIDIEQCQVLLDEQIINCTMTSDYSVGFCLIKLEQFCNGSRQIYNLNQCEAKCPECYQCAGEYSSYCKKRSTVCDGNICGGCDEDDEWEDGIGFRCVRNGKVCKIPQVMLWDGISDCDRGEDLCYAYPRDFRDSSETVCDGRFDCSDLSDECLCERNIPSLCFHIKMKFEDAIHRENPCELGQVHCGNGECINRSSVCDTIGDCFNNIDESSSFCGLTLQCKYGVQPGEPCRCPQTLATDCWATRDAFQPPINGTTCDGEAQCPPGQRYHLARFSSRDILWPTGRGYPADECEAKCGNSSQYNCTQSTTSSDPSRFYLSPGTFNYDTTGFVYGPERQDTQFCGTVKVVAYTCDGQIDCMYYNGTSLPTYIPENHDEVNCPERHYCKTFNNLVSIPNLNVCDGTIECQDVSEEKEENCTNRFYCPSFNGSKVSIDKAYKCDYYVNCDDASDELDCDDGWFFCENGEPLFVRKSQMFDGRPDCSDSSDECPTDSKFRNEDLFSSRYELIANPILRALVWIMGLLAMFGNLVALIGESRALKRIFMTSRSAPLRTNHVLILNLALADFFMGIYLIALGMVGALFSGEFCLHKLDWLASSTCSFLGVLVVVSSETSVMTLVAMTVCRLYAMLEPFKASTRPHLFTLFMIILSFWSVSVSLALIPLASTLHYAFASRALIEGNPFFANATVTFDAAKSWVGKLSNFDPNYFNSSLDLSKAIASTRSWNNLNDLIKESKQMTFLNVTGYFGYYSANSVCIPRMFVTKGDKSWGFSLAIMTFNFLAFVFVAMSYVFMLRRAKKDSHNRARISSLRRDVWENKMHKMQWKITRLVATDFCCWVPISILFFMNFFGVALADEAYVVSAIILLPINSALNPILYSDFIEKGVKKLKKRFSSRHEHVCTVLGKTNKGLTAL